jgi:hypothetical protein
MDRPQWRFTANYRLHQRLQVGVELNPKRFRGLFTTGISTACTSLRR